MTLTQSRKKAAWFGILVALVGGCVSNAPPLVAGNINKPSSKVIKADEVALVLGFFQRIRDMSHDSLSAEYALVTQALAKHRSDSNRLKLAILFSLPHAAFRDDGRAVALAEETLANKSIEPELRPLALYIAVVATEQKRQEVRYHLVSQKLREEERRAETRQQKLNALKTIEKDLISREQIKPLRVK